MRDRNRMLALVALIGLMACNPNGPSTSMDQGDPGDPSGSRASALCANPNMKVTVDGGGGFSTCGGYSGQVMFTYVIVGEGDGQWINLAFFTKDRGLVVPGHYEVSNGLDVPDGQSLGVGVTYKEKGPAPEHNFISGSGSVDLSIADGSHFKGTFTCMLQQHGSGTGTHTVSGTFDVHEDPKMNMGTLDEVSKKIKETTHGKVDLMDSVRNVIRKEQKSN